jgi:hypothetical protein
MDELECVIANLIFQKRIRGDSCYVLCYCNTSVDALSDKNVAGYIAHANALVLQKEEVGDPFP